MTNILKCRILLSCFFVGKTTRPWTNKVTGLFTEFMRYAGQKYESYDSMIPDFNKHDYDSYDKSKIVLTVDTLWKVLTEGDLSDIPWSEEIFEKRKLIYACVNPSHRKLYIGQTNSMVTRLSQHFTTARKHSQLGLQTDRFHSFMAFNSFADWLMVPIFLPIDHKSEVDRLEKRMIKMFGNSTLNSQHVVLRSRYVLGPNTKRKSKSLSKLKHNRSRHSKSKSNRTSDKEPLHNLTVQRPCSDKDSPHHLTVQRYCLKTIDKNSEKINAFCYDLVKILSTEDVKLCHMRPCIMVVEISGNHTVSTNWTTVRTQFGNSVVTVKGGFNGIERRLRDIIPDLKSGVITEFEIQKLNLWYNNDAYDTIDKLSRSTVRNANKLLKRTNFDTLLILRKQLNSISHHRRAKDNVCGHLDRILRRRFNFSYTCPLTLRIPYSPTLSKNDILQELHSMIKQLKVSNLLKKHLCLRTKVVFTKRRSIESILCNHRSFAKQLDSDTTITCKCKNFKNFPKVNGHVLCKGTDLPNYYNTTVLHANAKNVLVPHTFDVKQDLSYSLNAFNDSLSTMFNSSVCLKTPNIVPLSVRLEAASTIFEKTIVRSPKLASATHDMPSTQTVKRLKRELQGLVISPLDKNTGNLCIC